MGRAALRIIRADLRARPAQALLTGLVVAIAAGTLVVTFHLRGAFDDPWQDLVRATTAPDAVVDGPPAAVARIARGPAVSQADATAVQADIARAGDGKLHVTRPAESMAREAGELRPIVYGVTGLLVLIGLVNLLTTLLLGLRERERDVAILGAVGATPRQVAASVLAGGAALAVPAALIGVPVGAWLFGFLIARTDPSDGPDVATLPSVPLLALAIPGALLLTAAVSALPARQARDVVPARALRAE